MNADLMFDVVDYVNQESFRSAVRISYHTEQGQSEGLKKQHDDIISLQFFSTESLNYKKCPTSDHNTGGMFCDVL